MNPKYSTFNKTVLPSGTRIRVKGTDLTFAENVLPLENYAPSRVIALGTDRSTEGQEQELHAIVYRRVFFEFKGIHLGYNL